MSKKKSSKSSTSRGRRKKKSYQLSGLIIPIAVGLVIVAVIVGAVISVENRGDASASGGDAGALATMQALPAQSLPYPGVPRVSVDETVDKLEQGTGVLVDVRSKSSYDRSHAVGAISIPETEMAARLNELPTDQDLILYCT